MPLSQEEIARAISILEGLVQDYFYGDERAVPGGGAEQNYPGEYGHDPENFELMLQADRILDVLKSPAFCELVDITDECAKSVETCQSKETRSKEEEGEEKMADFCQRYGISEQHGSSGAPLMSSLVTGKKTKPQVSPTNIDDFLDEELTPADLTPDALQWVWEGSSSASNDRVSPDKSLEAGGSKGESPKVRKGQAEAERKKKPAGGRLTLANLVHHHKRKERGGKERREEADVDGREERSVIAEVSQLESIGQLEMTTTDPRSTSHSKHKVVSFAEPEEEHSEDGGEGGEGNGKGGGGGEGEQEGRSKATQDKHGAKDMLYFMRDSHSRSKIVEALQSRMNKRQVRLEPRPGLVEGTGARAHLNPLGAELVGRSSTGVFVSDVPPEVLDFNVDASAPSSSASAPSSSGVKERLQEGDQILEINGSPVDGVSSFEVRERLLELLERDKFVNIVVQFNPSGLMDYRRLYSTKN